MFCFEKKKEKKKEYKEIFTSEKIVYVNAFYYNKIYHKSIIRIAPTLL